MYSVALTKKGRLAIYSKTGEDEKQLFVAPSFDAFADDEDAPQDLVAAVAAKLGVNRVIELDI
jgi:hypothetical protein